MVQKDQVPEDLVLSVTQRGLDLTQFMVLNRVSLRSGAFKIVAHVIGSSHVIRYRQGRHSIWEVFACQRVLDPCQRYSFHRLIGQQLRIARSHGHELQFRADLHKLSEQPQVIAKLQAKYTDPATCLVVDFPSTPEYPTPPQTAVAMRWSKPGVAVVETVHTYPQVDGLVLTKSIFIPRKDK